MSSGLGLDIRHPLGLLFIVIGALLALYGIVTDPSVNARSLGYNVNLVWGVCLLIFGVICLLLAMRGRRKSAAAPESALPPGR